MATNLCSGNEEHISSSFRALAKALLAFCFLSASAYGQLPEFLRDAIRFMPAQDRLEESQVVIAKDGLEPIVRQFFDRFRSRRPELSSQQLELISQHEREILHFVKSKQPPAFTPDDQSITYINPIPEIYQFALKQYPRGIHQWAYVWAAKLAHESMHQRGCRDEALPNRYELKLLLSYRQSGNLAGELFERYVDFMRQATAAHDSEERIDVATRLEPTPPPVKR
jgi:hypothetical protein